MFKKTFLGIMLVIMSLSFANAAIVNYNGTGNYSQNGSEPLGSVISDISLNEGMSFNEGGPLDNGALLGYGGFDEFTINVGNPLHFWFTDVNDSVVNLYGVISSISQDSFIGNSFSFFGVNSSTGSIYEVSGSTSFRDGIVTSNSINVSGQFETVPEPGMMALIAIGLAGFYFSRKKRNIDSNGSGFPMIAA